MISSLSHGPPRSMDDFIHGMENSFILNNIYFLSSFQFCWFVFCLLFCFSLVFVYTALASRYFWHWLLASLYIYSDFFFLFYLRFVTAYTSGGAPHSWSAEPVSFLSWWRIWAGSICVVFLWSVSVSSTAINWVISAISPFVASMFLTFILEFVLDIWFTLMGMKLSFPASILLIPNLFSTEYLDEFLFYVI